jgi:glucan endo-1,3-beta-D-glucosidase
MQLTQLLALALSLATSEAAYKGFNYGNKKPDGSSKYQADFASEFETAQNLVGASGFTSARLYTMIQAGTANDPISAIPAAIAQNTSLLLGLWASGNNMDNELTALKAAISQYGEDLSKLVVGISVGSEDLYRNSVLGQKVNAGVGVDPHVLASYIEEVRSTISGTPLSGAPLGHVDTWNDWVNGSNAAVIDAVDWVGFDGYPYFQNTMANSIDDAKALFNEAVAKTKSAAGNKEVWITETGWPVSGKTENLAVASIPNAKRFWDEVGCPLFDNTNTWWYTLQDASGASVPNPSFGIVGSTLTTQPLFDLSCSKSNTTSSSAIASPTSTAAAGSASTAAAGGVAGGSTSSASGSSSGTGSSSGSGSGSNSNTGSASGAGGPGGAADHGTSGTSGSANSNGTSGSSSGSNSTSAAGNYGKYGPYGSYGSYNTTGGNGSNVTAPARPSSSVGNVGLSKSTGAASPSSTTMFTGAATSVSASVMHVALLALMVAIVA